MMILRVHCVIDASKIDLKLKVLYKRQMILALLNQNVVYSTFCNLLCCMYFLHLKKEVFVLCSWRSVLDVFLII